MIIEREEFLRILKEVHQNTKEYVDPYCDLCCTKEFQMFVTLTMVACVSSGNPANELTSALAVVMAIGAKIGRIQATKELTHISE